MRYLSYYTRSQILPYKYERISVKEVSIEKRSDCPKSRDPHLPLALVYVRTRRCNENLKFKCSSQSLSFKCMLLWRLKVLLSSKPLKDTRKLFEGFKRQTLETEMCNLLLSSLFFDIQSCVAWRNKTTWSFFSSQYCSFVKVHWCQESLLPQYHRLELLALLEVPPLLQGDKPPVVEMSIRI